MTREVSISGVSKYETANISGGDHTFTFDVRSIIVGVAGNVGVETKEGETAILPLAAGMFHPVNGITKIIAATTTATNIIGAQ